MSKMAEFSKKRRKDNPIYAFLTTKHFAIYILLVIFAPKLNVMAQTKCIRTIYKSEEFNSFFNDLPPKVKTKFDYTMQMVQTERVISTKFIKKLIETDFYEMRVSIGPNEYRTILFAIDKANIIECTKIILLNGFLKKSTKDYKKQIENANKILKEITL